MSAKSALVRGAKYLFDSNELPWTFSLPPWAPPRQRSLRKIRQLARQQMRAQLVANQGWIRTLTQILAWPAISTLKAAIATKPHPGSWGYKLGLFATYCRLQWIHNIRISDQEQHALMLPQRRAHAVEYMICRENQALTNIGSMRSRGYKNLHEKQIFSEFCSQNGLPTPSIIAKPSGDPAPGFTPWPKCDLLLKPSDMAKGEGIEIIRFDQSKDLWRGYNQIEVNAQTIEAYAKDRLQDEPWVLQPFLQNSSEWGIFQPACLSTARVVTGLIAKDAPPLCIAMYLRIPRQGAIIDNLSAGSISTQVDITTGRLSCGHIYREGFEEHTHHPDTGFPIEGTVLPQYQKLIDLALEAHKKAGEWISIGWDVSLTREGPMLIEANMHWAIMPRSPIIDTPYVEVLEHMMNQPVIYSDPPFTSSVSKNLIMIKF